MLAVVIALLVGMTLLVVAEMFVPSGSMPGLLYLVRELRKSLGRTKRYLQIVPILVRRGLLPYLWGGRRAEFRTSAGRAHLARSLRLALEEGGVTFVKLGQIVNDQDVLACNLFNCLLRQVMVDGIFHADPHPGNIFLLADGQLGLLDFGSVGRIDAEMRAALQRLLLAVNRGDAATFTEELLEIVGRLDALDEDLLHRSLGRFLARYVGPGLAPDNVRMFTDLFHIISEYGLSVPPEIAAVFRALATMEGTLSRLAPGFNIVAEARHFAVNYLAEQLRPGSLRQAATDELTALLPMLRRLPRHHRRADARRPERAALNEQRHALPVSRVLLPDGRCHSRSSSAGGDSALRHDLNHGH